MISEKKDKVCSPEEIICTAEANCEQSGMRLTSKRKNVLAVLLGSEVPLSAYEISERYSRSFGESITAVSVYRMLDFLISQNLVHRLNSENKYVACSHISSDNSHDVPQFLICDNCQKVKETHISKDIVKALIADVSASGFELRHPQLELHCLCEACASAG